MDKLQTPYELVEPLSIIESLKLLGIGFSSARTLVKFYCDFGRAITATDGGGIVDRNAILLRAKEIDYGESNGTLTDTTTRIRSRANCLAL